MTATPSLFDVEPGAAYETVRLPEHARNSDPDTSKEAADSMRSVLNFECHQVLEVVKAFGPGGITAYGVSMALAARGIHRQQNCVARRLSDLRDAGFIEDSGERRPGSSNRLLTVWRMVP